MAKILVSACLLGCKVRYDGNDLKVKTGNFQDILKTNEIVPFCPEVAGGLSVPRIAAEIIGGMGTDVLEGNAKIIGKDGSDLTEPFMQGAKLALELCQKNGIKQAILAEASPSCGSSEIYDGRFEGVKIKGQGLTCAYLQRDGIQVVSQHQVLVLQLGKV